MGRYESLASASRRAMPGRPGERYADSRPRRLAIRFCHSVAPYGRPRWTLRRSASNSLSLSARLTRSSQSSGTSNGHAAKTAVSSAVPRQRLQRLDQRHSSARTTKLARSALRCHVPRHGQEMLVLLQRKRLVTPLVDMPQAHIVPILLPPLHVGDGQALHESCQIAITIGPKEYMPMAGHQTVRAHPHRRFLQRLFQDPLERLVISRLLEHLHAQHPG